MKEARQHASAPTSICATGFNTPLILPRRWRRSKNIFAAHRSHLYQRHVIAGWRHRDVTLLCLTLLGVMLALAGGRQSGSELAAARLPLLGALLLGQVMRINVTRSSSVQSTQSADQS